MYHLVVTFPFDKYAPGDVITDEVEMAKWAVSHAQFVVRIVAPEPPKKTFQKPPPAKEPA